MVSDLLHKIGNEIISAMRSDIDASTGRLSNSIKQKVALSPLGAEMSISMLAYGQYVDTGTRGTKGAFGKKGGTTINRAFYISPELNGWAKSKGLNVWAVAKSIQMYGTKAHPFVHNFEDIINKKLPVISKAIGFDISDRIYKALIHGTNIN